MAHSAVGRVAAVWRHPVKSLQGEALATSEVVASGLAGDRAYGVRDGVTGRVLSAKREPRLLYASARYDGGAVVVTLPDATSYAVEDPALDSAMAEWLGRPVAVVAASMTRPSGDPFMDASAVHLLSDASLRWMAHEYPDGDWSVRRFRANLLVAVAGSDPAEHAWVGRRVVVGAVELEVAERTIRCPMTSMAQPGLGADPAILATTGLLAEKRLGVYADVVTTGVVSVGDDVVVAS